MNKTLPVARAALTPPDWWRKWRPLRWLLVLSLGWWVYGIWRERRIDIPPHPENAAFQVVQPVRVPFLDGLSSYDSVQETRFLLANQHAPYTEMLRAFAKSPRYPDYHLVTISVPSYTAHLSAGPLTLVYFNDRLMQATFEPENPGLIARDLERIYPTLAPDANGRAAMIDGPLKITTNVIGGARPAPPPGPALNRPGTDAARGRAFVTWEDLRLVRQLQSWEDRFGDTARHPPSLLRP